LNTHEQYEELCALVASGQASPAELTDLRSHLETCPDCRSTAYDFTQVSAQGLSELSAKRLQCQIPSGMTQRFVARARSEGIEIARENVPKVTETNRRAIFATIGAVAALILIAGLLAIGRQKSSPVAGDRRQLPADQTTVLPPGTASQDGRGGDALLQQQLSSVRAEMTAMGATIKAQRAELESASKDSDDLNARLTGAEQGSARTQAERSQRDARIAQLEGEIEKARSEKNASDTALALQEAEVRELRKQVSDEAAALGQRGSEVRDLVVARNLTSSMFTTVTEMARTNALLDEFSTPKGKSLIFYAYDLADPRKVGCKGFFLRLG
jgi:hypothetical protein